MMSGSRRRTQTVSLPNTHIPATTTTRIQHQKQTPACFLCVSTTPTISHHLLEHSSTVLALLLPQYPTVGSCCCLFVFKCIWRPRFAPTRVVVRRHRWPEPDSPLITRGLHGPGAFWLLALSSFGVSAPLCGLRLCVDCFACTSVQTGVGPVQRLSNAFAARSCCCCVCVRHRVLWCVDARLMKVVRESCLDRSRKSK